MKNILLLCLVISAYIIYPKNASAQYKSVFGKNSTSWSLIVGSCVDNFWSDSFSYTKDTLIHDTVYKIINANRNWNILLREDTVSGKLWMFEEFTYKREILVMDMSLQKGDTFPFFSSSAGETYFIPVDSVYYKNGLKIILLDFWMTCAYKEKLRFIEGTGPSAGFMNEGDEYEVIQGYMMCHFKDGKRVFSSRKFKERCYVNTLIGIDHEYNSSTLLKLYPNPTNGTGIITFQNEKNTCTNLEIYDLKGKKIFGNSTKNTYITFNINAFENGVYIYKLMNDKGEFSSGRIVKQ